MPTKDSSNTLRLAVLDRQEREDSTRWGTVIVSSYHLRLTLALVERMGEALAEIGCHHRTPCQDLFPDFRARWCARCKAFADYLRAKGEKPCEKCSGTGARHVAGEPVTSEACGECSGEGVVSA